MLSEALSGSGRQYRKAHVIGKITVGSIDIGVVQVGLVDTAFEIVHAHVGGDPAEVGEHAALDPDKRRKLLIENELAEEIRAERQHPQKELGESFIPGYTVGDKKTVAEIDLGFFRRFVIEPDGHLTRGGLTPRVFPKRPPKLYVPDVGGHLALDLLDRGPFAVDFLADIVPVHRIHPAAALSSRWSHWFQEFAHGTA